MTFVHSSWACHSLENHKLPSIDREGKTLAVELDPVILNVDQQRNFIQQKIVVKLLFYGTYKIIRIITLCPTIIFEAR